MYHSINQLNPQNQQSTNESLNAEVLKRPPTCQLQQLLVETAGQPHGFSPHPPLHLRAESNCNEP